MNTLTKSAVSSKRISRANIGEKGVLISAFKVSRPVLSMQKTDIRRRVVATAKSG
jgi:hypothetical protein